MIASPRPESRVHRRRPSLLDEGGASAVEFSLILPVFCLLMVGTIDVGGVLYSKFRLDSAVSAGANYALVNAAHVGSTSGSALASSIASVLNSTTSAGATTSGSVLVNNGPRATLTGGVITTSGTASNADSCYCPTGSVANLVWGSSQTCGSSCSGGGLAGKFVVIMTSKPHTASFSNYGLVQGGTVSSAMLVQAQ